MRRVVVTGMGVISPVGNTVKEFFDSLINGKCGIDYITKFDTSDFKVKVAAEVKNFDPLLYFEKSNVRKTDIYTQYAMGSAVQAMEDSGIEGKYNPERTGVYFGSGIGGINSLISEHRKALEGSYKHVSPFFIPMMISNIAAGNIAIRYNAQGPCMSIVTACATSTNCIGEAYRVIKDNYADVMVTGGSEAAIEPLDIAGFTSCMALSTSDNPFEASIPFDKRRSGFVMGEGAGALILEEYEHAVSRGAKIYAEVIGYGNTCDAHHITAPQPEAIASSKAIEQALINANLEDNMKIYINAHGTSTKLNDKTETLAIKKALGEKAQKVLVSSTKSMTGHMLGAAGAVEAIASILAIKTGMVPPTIGYKEADPECDLDYVPNKMRQENIDIAVSNSLGFGGHNASVAFKKFI